MKYLIIFSLIFAKTPMMAQTKTHFSKVKFNFTYEVAKQQAVISKMNNFMNIYSYGKMMLCEIPIYGGESLKSNNDETDIKISDKVKSFYYVLADYDKAIALRFNSLDDQKPTHLNFASLYTTVFNFNEKYIAAKADSKIKHYNADNFSVEEYLEANATTNSSTKLYFSGNPIFTNFSFSSPLEKSKDSKLMKVAIEENKVDSGQRFTWEILQMDAANALKVREFLENRILK